MQRFTVETAEVEKPLSHFAINRVVCRLFGELLSNIMVLR